MAHFYVGGIGFDAEQMPYGNCSNWGNCNNIGYINHSYWGNIRISSVLGDVAYWEGNGPAYVVVGPAVNMQFHDFSRVNGPVYFKCGGHW